MTEPLAPAAIGVATIPTDDLEPNPHNPRMLFDREPLETLKASIGKVGILVPLTVYWDSERSTYVILDGQRRWMCATELGHPEVPVNVVAEPTLVQNIVTMFQIHKLREDWELMPTALKLEVLMNELQERGEKALSLLTGLDKAVVARCKKLLAYPKKYQDMMLDPDPEKRVRADFFIELHAVRNDRFVNAMDWYQKDRFTRAMLDRYQAKKGIKAVTDFRVMKERISNARKAQRTEQIAVLLKEFVDDDNLEMDHLALKDVDVTTEARDIVNEVRKLDSTVSDIDASVYVGQEELWDSLEALASSIIKQLRAAGRRFTA